MRVIRQSVIKNEERLDLIDLRLQKEEAINLYCRRCMHADWSDYFERLYYVTNGNAAAFTIGMNRIVYLSETADRRSGDGTLSEMMLCYNSSSIPLSPCWNVASPCRG